MVSEPGRSRPAALSQRHVDALARGSGDEEALRIIRSARPPAGRGERASPVDGSHPIEVSAEEMRSLAHSAEVPAALLGRIVATRTREAQSAGTERAGAMPASAPSAAPPGGDGRPRAG
jgi:flagellar motor switch protein FliM